MATADTYPHIGISTDGKVVIEGTRYTIEHWHYHMTVNLFHRCLKVIDTFRRLSTVRLEAQVTVTATRTLSEWPLSCFAASAK